MDEHGPRKPGRFDDSTKTTIGVLVAMVVVLIAAGIGIATVRDAQDTIEKVKGVVTTSSTVPGASTTTVAASDLTAEQSRVVEEIKGQVSAIRGLPWKGTLPIKVLTKDQLAERVRALNATEIAKSREELTADESVLKLLQLIGKDVDYTKTLDAILAGGVLGFYDDEAKELFVGGGGSATLDPATKATLAHELTHALTDQHFDFGTRSQALDDADKTEEVAAFSALIEGDAELVANLWQERHLSERERRQASSGSTADPGVYANAPPYLLASLFFPYEDGLNFVEGRYKAGGFAEVDKAYRNPPTSTENILHPETYVAGQAATPPPLPDVAAATGCGKVDTGTLGEFDMAQVLARKLPRTDAENAAAGWNGDAYSVVRCGAALGLAERWQTDDLASATRLTDALTRWGRGWSGSTRATDGEGRFTGPAGSGRVVRTGGRVDLILADDAATADKVARVLLAA
jgi:hypothetical protein